MRIGHTRCLDFSTDGDTLTALLVTDFGTSKAYVSIKSDGTSTPVFAENDAEALDKWQASPNIEGVNNNRSGMYQS